MKYHTGFIIILIFLCSIGASAQQTTDRRTVSTRIADVLAKFPAADKKQYDTNVEQLQALGTEGLQQMLSMISPEGKGDNTALEYAVSAYSSSVMHGKQSGRKDAIAAYCNALTHLKDESNLTFIVRQLQLVGNDESLNCLAPLLKHEKLSGPAARAIAQVGTNSAGKVLIEALSDGSAIDKASVIEALGYIRYAPAASKVQSEYNSGNDAIKKAVVYALARIGDPASGKLLHDAAKKENFKLENTGTTAAYLNYLRTLAASGNKGAVNAATMASQMLTEANAAKNQNARIAALSLVAEFSGQKVLPLLYKAATDADMKYRGAALKIADKFRSQASNAQFISLMRSAQPAAKVQLIEYLSSSQGDAAVTSAIETNLNSQDTLVRHAAVRAIPSLHKEDKAILLLTDVLKKNRPSDLSVVRSALLRVNAADFGKTLAAQLDGLPAQAAATVLDVLAARRQEDAAPKVLELLDNKDTVVSNAAYRALPAVVRQEDLPRLYTLLTEAGNMQVRHVQNAITNASSNIKDTAQRTSEITTQMMKGSADRHHLYAPTLAAIGGREALSTVSDIYSKGNSEARKTVIGALSRNKDMRSASMLLNIARSGEEYKSDALNGYITIIQGGAFSAEQKVLMLQEAMDLANSDAQRKRIVQLAGRNDTYPSLVFAGKFLGTPALQQEAAFAVMNIALSHPEYNGNNVRQLLQKVSDLLKGQDSQYQKEAIRKHLAEMPAGEGFVSLFNGKDLSGWKGLVENPLKRAAMKPAELAEAQKIADAKMKEGWQVKDGLLVFTGKGDNIASEKHYEDFELLVDWKITPEGDAGIYLRGTPQVQIWDTARRDAGAQVGSGGLYNNEKNASKPLKVADNPVGEWNTFRIIMRGDKVTVYLNGQLVTDNVSLENYWDRKQPIFPKEQIELQAHGTHVAYRNIYIKELPGSRPYELPEEEKKENYELLFNGTNLDKWTGNKKDYVIEGNELVIKPSEGGGGGNLFTQKEYGDFIFRFEFMLTPGANNGLAIRAPLEGDAAYTGMELQILDNDADIYKDLKPYQYHGSVYGVIPAKRGFLKPTGEWNYQEVEVKGTKIKVTLNGTVILDGDLKEAREKGTLDGENHPGIKRDRGHIGFLGHGSVLRFKNIRVKEL
jgi:hypothetical protein